MIRKPLKVAAIFSSFLAILKLLCFFYTGSLLLLASFYDSLIDSASSLINHKISKFSLEKPDKEHPFGHGGYEVLASLCQGMLIGFLGLSLLVESGRKITLKSDHLNYNSVWTGVIVLGFSAFAGAFIYFYLGKHLKRLEANNERSLSLASDRVHYSGDAIVNALGALALIGVYYTQNRYFDIVGGFVGGFTLIIMSMPLLKKVIQDITHSEAPPALQQDIVDIVMIVDSRIKGIHQLRSRHYGPYLFVDFHMKVEDKLSLKEAHDIGEKVEERIKAKIKHSDIFIHLDPESEPDDQVWNPSYEMPSKKQ